MGARKRTHAMDSHTPSQGVRALQGGQSLQSLQSLDGQEALAAEQAQQPQHVAQLMSLQRTLGNQAVVQLLSRSRVDTRPPTAQEGGGHGVATALQRTIGTRAVSQILTTARNGQPGNVARQPSGAGLQQPVIQRLLMTRDEFVAEAGDAYARVKGAALEKANEVLGRLNDFHASFVTIRQQVLSDPGKYGESIFDRKAGLARGYLQEAKTAVDEFLAAYADRVEHTGLGGKLGKAFSTKGHKEKVGASNRLTALMRKLQEQILTEGGRTIINYGLSIMEDFEKRKLVEASDEQKQRAGEFVDSRFKTIKEKLGSGAINTVSLVEDIATGKQFVFKADKNESMPALDEAGSNVETGAAGFAARAVATYRLDQLLGFDVVPETHFAEKDGYFGHVMALAKGHEVHESARKEVDLSGPAVYGSAASKGKELQQFADTGQLDLYLGAKKANRLEEDVAEGKIYQKIHASYDIDFANDQVQEQLTALQLVDLLSGQVDRHEGNYFVDVDGTGRVKVTAIDNDAAFGAEHEDISKSTGRASKLVGLPAVVSLKQASKILTITPQQIVDAIGDLLSEQEVNATVSRLKMLQDHLQKLWDNGELVTDFDAESFKKMNDRNSYAARELATKERRRGQDEKLILEFAPIPSKKSLVDPNRAKRRFQARMQGAKHGLKIGANRT